MTDNKFKKITFAFATIVVILIAYLAFVRDTGSDSATLRNADFLNIKSSTSAESVSNQNKLSIDSDGTESTSDKPGDKTSSITTNKETKPKFYTVKEGDTYGCIAEKYYGSYEHWPDILNANIVYGSGYSEHELHVGAIIELPEILAENLKPSSKLCS